MSEPNYRAFARDLMKICKKHGVKISAHDEGTVIIGPAAARTLGEFPYNDLEATPVEVVLGDGEHKVHMR